MARKRKIKRKAPDTILLSNVDPAWDLPDRKAAEKQARSIAAALRRHGNSLRTILVRHADILPLLAPFNADKLAVLNWCEALPGIRHSEAMVTELLESLRFSFTGASSETINLCGDKPRVKMILQKEHIPTPRWRVFKRPERSAWNIFPAIVKPAYEHGSTGVSSDSIVRGPDELLARIRFMCETYQQPVLVEEFIDGREIFIAVIGNERLEVLPAVEMDFSALGNPRDHIYSYDAKFTPGTLAFEKTRQVCPAPLTTEEAQIAGELAQHIFRTLNCRDYARVDFRLKNGIFFMLDVNPNCDLHIECALTAAARAAGYTYGSLLDRILSFAHARRLRAIEAAKLTPPASDAMATLSESEPAGPAASAAGSPEDPVQGSHTSILSGQG